MASNQGIVKSTFISLVALIIVYAIFYLWLDIPIDTWTHQIFPNTVLFYIAETINLIFKPEMWLVVGIIVGLISYFFKANKTQKKSFLFFCFSVIVAYVLCAILKFLLARYRPIEFFNSGLYGFHFFAFGHDITSSPSGVATMAFAGLYALAAIINKKAITVLFMIIAIIISLSRLVTVEHYPSDLIFGAWLGIMSVEWCRYFLSYRKLI